MHTFFLMADMFEDKPVLFSVEKHIIFTKLFIRQLMSVATSMSMFFSDFLVIFWTDFSCFWLENAVMSHKKIALLFFLIL